MDVPAPLDWILRSFLAVLPEDVTSFKQRVRTVGPEVWPGLFECSVHHGVSGMLEPYLERDQLPDAVWKSFVLARTAQELSSRRLRRALEVVAARFNDAGIRVCALKGPALAERLFADPSVRVSTDLDFLLSSAALDRAVEILRTAGYTGSSDATTAYLLQHSHHLDFTKPDEPPIELHFHSYVGFGATLPASALLDRAVEYQLNERCTILVPSVEDELIYLAVHAAGHSFVRLSWLYEMKILILKNPQLNWDQIVVRSREAGIAMAVRYAIELLVVWLEMPLRDVIRLFPRSTLRTLAANAMLTTAATDSGRSPVSNFKGLLFSALLCDRVRSTAWLVQHHVLRSARRRVHGLSPTALPASWGG